MNIGILGGGNISDTHARAARAIPGVDIVAMFGQNVARTTALAARYGGKVFETLDAFLDHRPMDLILIGSPSALHADEGIAAAARGLHILTEKPLDVTTARCDALIEAADRAAVKLGVFFQDRLKPDVVKMKTVLDNGVLGKPILASGRVRWYRPKEYYSESRWRGKQALDGGGAVMNQAIHTVDLLLHLFGPIVRIDARAAAQLHAIEVEDTAVATLEFANGALGTFEASTAVYPGYARRVEITGSGGTLVLEHDSLISVDLAPGASAPGIDIAPPAEPSALNAASPTVADATPHQRVLEDFIAAIRSGGTPVCDGREGRRSVAVVEAMYASARAAGPATIA